ncbi:AI-2E family transporter [Enterococcus sp. AD013-P3]|uniref:AI-2E family transporter n=1 Tax=Enterococcus sp. AD013-P3 TaxID=3411036 RepID=UPI003B955567
MKERGSNRLIAFFGGKTSYFVLGLISLTAITILLLREVSFIFRPLAVIIGTALPPVVFAMILYYMLRPVVDFAAEKGVPRTISLAVTYILLVGLLVFGGFQLFPVIQQQTLDLVDKLPEYAKGFQNSLESFINNTPLADQFQQLMDSLDSITDNLFGFISDNWQDGAKSLGNIFSTISTVGVTLFTGPIIAFFLIKSPNKFYRNVMNIVPPRFRRDTHELIKTADQQIGAFLKGQVIASILLGVIYWICFLLIGLPFATVIALAAGILNIVPYIGAFVAFIPALFVAFQDSGFMLIKFVIVWFAVQLLHGDLVVPRVLGDRLKIHPITILVVLLVMGDLLGFVGVVFGIPIYSLVKIAVVFCFRKFKQRYNHFFGDDGKYRNTEFTEKDY